MEDLKNRIIFFSWQSDLPESRKIISKALISAREKLLNTEDKIDIIIDQGTASVPGMPQIDSTILSKIMNCDVFVADVTPVHLVGEDLLPNPNVLLELGFAMGVVGMSRIILLAQKGAWNAKDLPFDINHRRIDFFDDMNDLKGLSDWIAMCFKAAEETGKRDARMRRMEHDIYKFRELDSFCSEEVFKDSFDTISRTTRFNDYELDIWEAVREWFSKTDNMFITKSIQESAQDLLAALSGFLHFTVKYWSASNRRWCPDTPKNEKDEIRIKLQRYYEWEPEGPRYSSFYLEREDVVLNGLNQHLPPIMGAYDIFRKTVKYELYV